MENLSFSNCMLMILCLFQLRVTQEQSKAKLANELAMIDHVCLFHCFGIQVACNRNQNPFCSLKQNTDVVTKFHCTIGKNILVKQIYKLF
jgi:hypothetical protein